MTIAASAGRRIRIVGTVLGVGFRPWVYRAATREGITDRVRNDAGGVTIDAFGDPASLARFIAALGTPPPAARIERLEVVDIASEDRPSFDIVASEQGSGPRVSIPPDLATCDDCVAEIFDPTSEGTCRIWHEYGGIPDLQTRSAERLALQPAAEREPFRRAGKAGP
jgi:hydrogenase maturation protein HypF